MLKIIHSSTGREEQKRKAQKRMERGSRKRSSSAGIEEMGIGGWRQEKMEGHFSTGQSPQWAVISMEEEEVEEVEEKEDIDDNDVDDDVCLTFQSNISLVCFCNNYRFVANCRLPKFLYKLEILFEMSVSDIKNEDYPKYS